MRVRRLGFIGFTSALLIAGSYPVRAQTPSYYITSKFNLESLDASKGIVGQRNWNNQRWELREIGDGVYAISLYGSLYLTVVSGRQLGVTLSGKGDLGPNRRWQLFLNRDSSYSIASEDRRACLDVGLPPFVEGTPVLYEPCDNSETQKWWFESAGSKVSVYTGIAPDAFPFSSAKQGMTAWTWAASLEMLLSYYGASQSQTKIIQRSFAVDDVAEIPQLADESSTQNLRGFATLTTRLNNWDVGTEKSPNSLKALVLKNAPSSSYLIAYLDRARPIMAALHIGSDRVMLIIGATYSDTVRTVIVEDPLYGPRQYPATAFFNSMIAYWELDLERALTYSELESSLAAILNETAEQFRSEISRIPARRVTDPNGKSRTVYSFSSMRKALVNSKTNLMAELDQPEFAGLKAYVSKSFPIAQVTTSQDSIIREPMLRTQLSHRFLDQQVEETEFKKIIAGVEEFFSKLSQNKKSVNLEVQSLPDGATFVFTAEGGNSRTNDTNARITNIFRGLYTFRLSKEGYRTISREVNLVDEAANTIVCKIYASQAGSCVLK